MSRGIGYVYKRHDHQWVLHGVCRVQVQSVQQLYHYHVIGRILGPADRARSCGRSRHTRRLYRGTGVGTPPAVGLRNHWRSSPLGSSDDLLARPSGRRSLRRFSQPAADRLTVAEEVASGLRQVDLFAQFPEQRQAGRPPADGSASTPRMAPAHFLGCPAVWTRTAWLHENRQAAAVSAASDSWCAAVAQQVSWHTLHGAAERIITFMDP